MSWWDAFTGAAQKKAIQQGSQQATQNLQTHFGAAGNWLQQANDTATGMLAPWITGGEQYRQYRDDLSGLGGEQARADAQRRLTSDPLWQGQLATQQNAMLRNLNARGLAGSGTAALAGQRVLYENYGRERDRIDNLAGQGFQAATMGADLASRYGTQRAGLETGLGQQLAGVNITTGNALAQAASTPINNLMGLGSMLISGFTPAGFSGVSPFGKMASLASQGWNKLWGAGAQTATTQPAQPPPGYYTNPLFSTVPYGGM